MYPSNAHLVRPATPSDTVALRRIALLDRHTPLAGRIYVAEVEGRVAAAISRDEYRSIADRSVAPQWLTTVLRLRMVALDAARRQPNLSDRLREALQDGRATARPSRASLAPTTLGAPDVMAELPKIPALVS